MRPQTQRFFEILHNVVNRVFENFRTSRIPCIHVPLLLHFVKPLEVDWSATHWTPSASAFEVPTLYTPRAKLMATAQLAARTIFVAYRALHCLLKSLLCSGFDTHITRFYLKRRCIFSRPERERWVRGLYFRFDLLFRFSIKIIFAKAFELVGLG